MNSSRYEIRVYGIGVESFVTARVSATSYSGATSAGFGKNFNYISGANSQNVHIPMTAPVVTRTLDEKNWLVSFFTPQSIYPTLASVPIPTDSSVSIEAFPLSTFAVIEFGGEAGESDYKIASNLLKDALAQDNITLADAGDVWSEAWCGYDAPNDIFHRHNEAWVKIVLG